MNAKFITLKNKEQLPYKRKNLLTENEKRFYKKLKPITDKYNLELLTKIRMADIIEVSETVNKTEWSKYFSKIKSKHIDFAITDKDNLNILLLIELDDSSHKEKSRIERDNFINQAYISAGIPIARLYYNTSNLEEIITMCIKKVTGSIDQSR